MATVVKADKVIDAENGDLRVWWVSNRAPAEYVIVGSPEEALTTLEAFTKRDLANPAITINAGGLEEYDPEAGWTEWYNEHEESIDEIGDHND